MVRGYWADAAVDTVPGVHMFGLGDEGFDARRVNIRGEQFWRRRGGH